MYWTATHTLDDPKLPGGYMLNYKGTNRSMSVAMYLDKGRINRIIEAIATRFTATKS